MFCIYFFIFRDDILNEWIKIIKCLFLRKKKKITHHLTTPTLLTLPLVTIVLYVLINTFFSRLHFIWYRKFAPCRPRPFTNLFHLHISLLRWLLFCYSFPPFSSTNSKNECTNTLPRNRLHNYSDILT